MTQKDTSHKQMSQEELIGSIRQERIKDEVQCILFEKEERAKHGFKILLTLLFSQIILSIIGIIIILTDHT